MFQKLAIAALLVMIVGPSSGADEEQSMLEQYLTISEPEIKITDEPYPDFSLLGAEIIQDDCQPLGVRSEAVLPIEEEFDSIVAIGEKIWKLIEAGRPVVNYKAPVAHALPALALCWMDLENWRPPVSQRLEVIYKNAFNMDVVKLRFRVVYSPGGSYQGKGQYLANVTVLPETVEASWGYNVNAEAVVGRALNLGTRDNPIAGLQLMVTWNVKTVVKDSTSAESFFVRAD